MLQAFQVDIMLRSQFSLAIQKTIFLFCIASLVACSSKLDLYTNLSEFDANQVVAALKDGGLDGQKQAAKIGFIVRVPENELPSAVALLKSQGLPKQSYMRMGDVFKKDGMISTPLEERGRYLYALSQELENTLSQIDGVVLARVHPVLPERIVPGDPVQPSSCSVLIKYRPQLNPNIYEDKIRHLVSSSIPGLAKALPTAISIVFVPMTVDGEENTLVTPKANLDHDKSDSLLRWFVLFVLGLGVCMSIGALFNWHGRDGMKFISALLKIRKNNN